MTEVQSNIFVAAWDKAIREMFTFEHSTSGSTAIFHFISNIMNALYPDNNTFSSFELKYSYWAEQTSQFLESFLLNHWGTYFYEISDKDKYINTDIKCGDIFFLEHNIEITSAKMAPYLYIGDGHFFHNDMRGYEAIENIEKSPHNSTLRWVLRYNFNRADGKTPSGDDDISTWEEFWGEPYSAQMVKLSKEISDITQDNSSLFGKAT